MTTTVPILYLYRGTTVSVTTASGVARFAARYGPVLAAVMGPNCLLAVGVLIRRTPLVVSLTQTQILLPSILHHVGAHLLKT